jgi:hypothetical protein
MLSGAIAQPERAEIFARPCRCSCEISWLRRTSVLSGIPRYLSLRCEAVRAPLPRGRRPGARRLWPRCHARFACGCCWPPSDFRQPCSSVRLEPSSALRPNDVLQTSQTQRQLRFGIDTIVIYPRRERLFLHSDPAVMGFCLIPLPTFRRRRTVYTQPAARPVRVRRRRSWCCCVPICC